MGSRRSKACTAQPLAIVVEDLHWGDEGPRRGRASRSSSLAPLPPGAEG